MHELSVCQALLTQIADIAADHGASGVERVVIEIDGKQHYADGETASPQRYAAMVAEDRNLRLLGYEVYRFGGFELTQGDPRAIVEPFLNRLIKRSP